MDTEADPAVLVLDRCPAWGRLVSDALGIAGVQVDWVANLQLAVEWLESARHDLAIVDTELGPYGTADLVRELRARRPDLRIVVAAHDGEHHREAAAVEALFVPRGLGVQRLREIVEACLGPSQA